MKILLVFSLIFNFFLSYLLFQKKSERKLSKYITQTTPKKIPITKTKQAKLPEITKTSEKELHPEKTEEVPAIAFDDYSFNQANTEMNHKKQEFYNKTEISAEMIRIKEELVQNYWQDYSQLSGRNADWEISFSKRIELLKREEKLHNDLEALFTKKKWNSYKEFIDNHNQKTHEARIEEGFGPGGLIFSYY